jgi:hypothetical protein
MLIVPLFPPVTNVLCLPFPYDPEISQTNCPSQSTHGKSPSLLAIRYISIRPSTSLFLFDSFVPSYFTHLHPSSFFLLNPFFYCICLLFYLPSPSTTFPSSHMHIVCADSSHLPTQSHRIPARFSHIVR